MGIETRLHRHILASLPLPGGARLLLTNGIYATISYQAPDGGITTMAHHSSVRQARDAVTKMWGDYMVKEGRI